jgi:hypothetical protein
VKVWWKMFFTITVPAAQLLFENWPHWCGQTTQIVQRWPT